MSNAPKAELTRDAEKLLSASKDISTNTQPEVTRGLTVFAGARTIRATNSVGLGARLLNLSLFPRHGEIKQPESAQHEDSCKYHDSSYDELNASRAAKMLQGHEGTEEGKA